MNKSDYALSKQDILCTYGTYQTLMPTEKEKKKPLKVLIRDDMGIILQAGCSSSQCLLKLQFLLESFYKKDFVGMFTHMPETGNN